MADDADTIEYRFSSLTLSGQFKLSDDSVSERFSATGNTWCQELPLSLVAPQYVRVSETLSSFWWIAAISFAGAVFGFWSLVAAESPLEFAAGLTAVGTSLILFAYVIRYRRLHWCVFPTALPGITIAVACGTADTERFDQFVTTVQSRARYKPG